MFFCAVLLVFFTSNWKSCCQIFVILLRRPHFNVWRFHLKKNYLINPEKLHLTVEFTIDINLKTEFSNNNNYLEGKK